MHTTAEHCLWKNIKLRKKNIVPVSSKLQNTSTRFHEVHANSTVVLKINS